MVCCNTYLFGSFFGRLRLRRGLPLVVIVVGLLLSRGDGLLLLFLIVIPDQTLHAQVLGHFQKPVQFFFVDIDLAAIDKVDDGPQVLGADSAHKEQRLAVSVARCGGLQELLQHGAACGQNNPIKY